MLRRHWSASKSREVTTATDCSGTWTTSPFTEWSALNRSTFAIAVLKLSRESMSRAPNVCSSRFTGNPSSVMARRSEEHTSELQSLMRISYAVFCLKKKKNRQTIHTYTKQLYV